MRTCALQPMMILTGLDAAGAASFILALAETVMTGDEDEKDEDVTWWLFAPVAGGAGHESVLGAQHEDSMEHMTTLSRN